MPTKYDDQSDWKPQDYLERMKLNAVHKSPTDPKDYLRVAQTRIPVSLPESFLLPQPPIFNQLDLGSCGAFALLRIFYIDRLQKGLGAFDGSEMLQYLLTLEEQNSLCSDMGSIMRTAASQITKVGIAEESVLQYRSVNLCHVPTAAQRAAAASNKALSYFRVDGNVLALKQSLYGSNGSDGRASTACFLVKENFTPGPDGVLPLPSGRTLGGHATTFVGYNRVGFIAANQWGESWGAGGYFTIPYTMFDLPENEGGIWRSDIWSLDFGSPPPPEPSPFDPDEPPTDPIQRASWDRGYNVGFNKSFNIGFNAGWDACRKYFFRGVSLPDTPQEQSERSMMLRLLLAEARKTHGLDR